MMETDRIDPGRLIAVHDTIRICQQVCVNTQIPFHTLKQRAPYDTGIEGIKPFSELRARGRGGALEWRFQIRPGQKSNLGRSIPKYTKTMGSNPSFTRGYLR
jgi:hypothetical protein